MHYRFDFNLKFTTSTSVQTNHPITKISYWMILFILIICNGCVVIISNPGQSPELSDEFSSHLQTLQDRYDLTGSLKTTKMMVRIQEEGSPPDYLHEMLWYKKASDGSDLLRIQALGGFNDTKGVAIANRNRFLLVLLDEQEAYLGKLSDGVLRKIFGLDLRVSDMLSAIFANPFLDGRMNDLSIESTGNTFIVSRPNTEPDHTETITVTIKDGEPRVTEWKIQNNKKAIKQHVVFLDYRVVDGVLRPSTVKFERPIEQTSVVITIAEVQLNVEIDDSQFDFQPFLNDDMEIILISDPEKSDTQK
ncbi:DUF4292 domain-containing protein [Candidatus Poribacteria bacterium]|nr:DUF4292 domain-containing protein [Candidatus Poribacteria bacterium]